MKKESKKQVNKEIEFQGNKLPLHDNDNNLQRSIDYLKSKGYKVYRPKLTYEEI